MKIQISLIIATLLFPVITYAETDQFGGYKQFPSTIEEYPKDVWVLCTSDMDKQQPEAQCIRHRSYTIKGQRVRPVNSSTLCKQEFANGTEEFGRAQSTFSSHAYYASPDTPRQKSRYHGKESKSLCEVACNKLHGTCLSSLDLPEKVTKK